MLLIFTIFSGLAGVWDGLISLSWYFILRILNWDVTVATNFRGKIGEIDHIPSFVVLAFRNGLQYRNSDFKTLIDMNLSAWCRNLV